MLKSVAFTLLILPVVAFAGWINKQGVPLPDSDSRKAVGDFGAQMVFVADERELFKHWTNSSDTLDIKTTRKVETDASINAFIIFSGCKTDKAGHCNVSMRFRVLQPDGKIYAETPPMEVWHRKPAPPGKSLELSVQYFKIVIEPNDQLGDYVVHAQIKDENSGTVLQLKDVFTAIPK